MLRKLAAALGAVIAMQRPIEQRAWRGEVAYLRWKAIHRTRPGR